MALAVEAWRLGTPDGWVLELSEGWFTPLCLGWAEPGVNWLVSGHLHRNLCAQASSQCGGGVLCLIFAVISTRASWVETSIESPRVLEERTQTPPLDGRNINSFYTLYIVSINIIMFVIFVHMELNNIH